MNDLLLNRLQEFPPNMGMELSAGMLGRLQQLWGGSTLVTPRHEHGDVAWYPTRGAQSITNKSTLKKLCTIGIETKPLTKQLITDLKGGQNYPVLSTGQDVVFGITTAIVFAEAAVFATAVGAVWSIGSGVASATKRTGDFLPRTGDVVIAVERFGKMKQHNLLSRDQLIPAYSLAYILVDAYRMKARCSDMGWIIHEVRHPISLT